MERNFVLAHCSVNNPVMMCAFLSFHNLFSPVNSTAPTLNPGASTIHGCRQHQIEEIPDFVIEEIPDSSGPTSFCIHCCLELSVAAATQAWRPADKMRELSSRAEGLSILMMRG